MRRSLLSASVLTILSLLLVPSSAGIAKNAMRLEDVTTLVFTKNEMTAARRSSAVPQLLCTEGACQYAPNTAMCKNIGFDGRDVAWKCEAELPKGIKFGKVQVSCEGFANRDDEYVLKGSCGLEYSLEGKPRFDVEDKEDLSFIERHTQSAARGYSKFSWWNPTTWSLMSFIPFFGAPVNAMNHAKDYARHGYDSASHAARDSYHHAKHDLHHQSSMFPSMGDLISTLVSMTIKFLALAVFLYVLYKIMCPTRSYSAPAHAVGPTPQRGLMRSVFGILPFGGAVLSAFDALTGPSDVHHAPPPSYQQSVNNNGFDKTRTTSQTTYQQAQPQAQQSNWGFLHGALGGAAAGYLLGGRRGRAAAETQTREEVRRAASTAPPAFNPASASYSTRDDARYPTASAAPYTADVPEVKTTETTTAFATTRRR